MTKKFKNSYELAYYFIKQENDFRAWGILKPFAYTPVYHYYRWDMGDKYVRGKNIFSPYLSAEYQEAEHKTISDFIDYIDTKLTFPLEMTITITNACGGGCDFKTEFITINDQLNFCNLM